MLELVLGGVKSGKSAYAEKLASLSAHEWPPLETSSQDVCYIATADYQYDSNDSSMQNRIIRHRKRRPDHWQLIEEPLYLSRALEVTPSTVVLIDCMGLWLTNLLLQDQKNLLQQQIDLFLKALEASPKHVIIVSSETGLGVVPLGDLSRDFVDHCGELNQRIAAISNRVWFTIAGIPQLIKDEKSGRNLV